MKTNKQTTYTFELSNSELQEAIASYLTKRAVVDITIYPTKLKFSGNDISDGVVELLIVEYKA